MPSSKNNQWDGSFGRCTVYCNRGTKQVFCMYYRRGMIILYNYCTRHLYNCPGHIPKVKLKTSLRRDGVPKFRILEGRPAASPGLGLGVSPMLLPTPLLMTWTIDITKGLIPVLSSTSTWNNALPSFKRFLVMFRIILRTFHYDHSPSESLWWKVSLGTVERDRDYHYKSFLTNQVGRSHQLHGNVTYVSQTICSAQENHLKWSIPLISFNSC